MSPTYAITVIAPRSSLGELSGFHRLIDTNGLSVVERRDHPVPRTLAGRRAAATWLFAGELPGNDVRAALTHLAAESNEDYVIQTLDARLADYRLAVFDMDSTLLECEVIDELAARAGVGDAVAAITERAMAGELDFNASFTERVAMLRGLSDEVLGQIAAALPVTEGVKELILTLRARGIRTAILSGGFDVFANHLKQQFQFDEVHANALDIEDGLVTGKVTSTIVDGARKQALLTQIAGQMGIELSQTIAVGDGANDLPMLGTAGLGVAFRAKPIVSAQAEYAIKHAGLDAVLYLLGAPSEREPS